MLSGKQSSQSLTSGPQQRAAFFDRDGVLIVDTGYLSDPNDIQWIDGAQQALSRLAALGYRLFVVTNQSGVARGFFEEAAIGNVHAAMQAQLPPDARFDDIAYCPHHPAGVVAAYSVECACRKPAPGMLNTLIDRHQILRGGSFMIGDKASDMQAAARADVKGFLFSGGNLDHFVSGIVSQL